MQFFKDQMKQVSNQSCLLCSIQNVNTKWTELTDKKVSRKEVEKQSKRQGGASTGPTFSYMIVSCVKTGAFIVRIRWQGPFEDWLLKYECQILNAEVWMLPRFER